MTYEPLPWNTSEIISSPQMLRSFFMVRNIFMKSKLNEHSQMAVEFLEMAHQLRLQSIRTHPTIRSYLAFMLGGQAATPIERCRFYGPTVHNEMTIQHVDAESVTIVDALADSDPERLPVLIVISGGRRGSIEFVL